MAKYSSRCPSGSWKNTEAAGIQPMAEGSAIQGVIHLSPLTRCQLPVF
jgi:hypothetical protein